MEWISAYDEQQVDRLPNGTDVIALMDNGSVVWGGLGKKENVIIAIDGQKFSLDDAFKIASIYG